MTPGAVIVTISLLARIYAADPAVMTCLVQAESDFDVNAVNGVHMGLLQWNPDTLDWLGGKARMDPLWLHGYMDASEPVYQIALGAWAISRGYGSHWSTYSMCKEGE